MLNNSPLSIDCSDCKVKGICKYTEAAEKIFAEANSLKTEIELDSLKSEFISITAKCKHYIPQNASIAWPR